MAWVKTFSEEEAEGRLKGVYDDVLKRLPGGSRVPEILKCMGLRPEAMDRVLRLNMGITFGASTLGRAREEMIALAVSAWNRCRY